VSPGRLGGEPPQAALDLVADILSKILSGVEGVPCPPIHWYPGMRREHPSHNRSVYRLLRRVSGRATAPA
jgi:hypothetical protein